MLEVTILKTKHSERTEAQKVIPYIGRCHVFSPEFAACTEQVARKREQLWKETTMNERLTRRDFANFTAQNDPFNNGNTADHDEEEYVRRITRELYTARRLIYVAERFSTEESEELSTTFKQALTYEDCLKEEFRKTQNEETERSFYEILRVLGEVRSYRDKHIAKNLETAEEYLRDSYKNTRIAKKDPLKLVLQIGALHRIEKHLRIPVRIITLTNYNSKSAQASQAIEDGKSYEEIRPLLLEALQERECE